MTNTDPVWSAGDKSPELESGANIHKLLSPPSAAFQQAASSDPEMPPEDLSTRLRQISRISMSEVSQLINELQLLQKKFQRDIEAYANLSQQVMQITSIITDSVKKLPTSEGISPCRHIVAV
jgi:Mg2+ and Co2+ transporter CorA